MTAHNLWSKTPQGNLVMALSCQVSPDGQIILRSFQPEGFEDRYQQPEAVTAEFDEMLREGLQAARTA